ncbi:MAG: sigma-70 family RNA polymerase sigma factor [Candidatus Parcubacteria bacterium]|nr:sigma-70 family RNA polymerase sigma factor [Candidatus Parcubacteria bacterium]
MENLSDTQLIEEYLQGNEESLRDLFSRYLKPIYTFIFRYINDGNEAQDLTQEVFIRVWKNLKKFDKQKRFKPWIFKIAKNITIDFLRQKKNIPFSNFENDKENSLAETISDPAPLPSELFADKELKQKLEAVLQKLAPQNRLVLTMYYNDHYNFREIAEILNESLNTIKSRQRRAIIDLRKLLIK